MIRISLKSAKLLGRDTQGVRLMRLEAKDEVASVSILEGEVEEQNLELKEETGEKAEIQANETKPEIEVNYYDKKNG